jgi:tetratricopeptide (TPR) repeat protein
VNAVNTPILLDYYGGLTEGAESEIGDLSDFFQKVRDRYTEGTLLRLLEMGSDKSREAALVALRLLGTINSNAAVSACLQDEDQAIRQLAEGTLWSLWFRAGAQEENEELQRLARLIVEEQYPKAMLGLSRLIRRAPEFAEAYNQRAILFWRLNDFRNSIADCERALELNPYHFGAQAGIGQCYLSLRMPVEALNSFRKALLLNPNLKGVQDSIEALEQFLGADGGD